MPNNLGSSLIDFGLGVVVQAVCMHTNSLQARASPCYFEPWQYFSMGLATNSTTHIEQALLELQQKGGLVEDGADISHNVQEVD